MFSKASRLCYPYAVVKEPFGMPAVRALAAQPGESLYLPRDPPRINHFIHSFGKILPKLSLLRPACPPVENRCGGPNRPPVLARHWRRPDSNRRPSGCKPDALPTELRPLHNCRSTLAGTPATRFDPHADPRQDSSRQPLNSMGLVGFEPTTSPLSGVRSNQLSYRPAHPAEA